jgi:hypothetical protein
MKNRKEGKMVRKAGRVSLLPFILFAIGGVAGVAGINMDNVPLVAGGCVLLLITLIYMTLTW